MTLLALGQSGQVARELAEVGVRCIGRAEADLNDPLRCAALIAASDATAVINAAAYTAVDTAEEEEAQAHKINAEAPGAIAQLCAAKNIPFVQISTDYVFDGSGNQPRQPGDVTAPLGAYGRTKLAGEVAVRAAGGPHAILRTSWVFSAHGSNFVKTMLRLGRDRDCLTIVADQIGGPTPARAIAAACVEIANGLSRDPGLSGTYHFSGAPDVSWADFARTIFDVAGITCTVEGIPSEDYPTPAKRPLNSRLDCASTQAAFGLHRPAWREGLHAVVKDLQSR
ncbi:dTDP-4-dehydrorhamnose reductase [Hasllibacter sp. MH4015]|uniref:dTDP-4-dehydrorhamnose reductase n=1 Tax=Hasllibacter sp. MH4015 TaxID=2854029 RepID=UPI001CD42C70|nr:dTDP-4-dehydrorhamnose reductase [Hasllibacter sp. MH4015]